LGYGVYSSDLRRTLNFVTPALEARGNFRADLLMGFGEAGFDLVRTGPLTLQPFAGFTLANIMTSRFRETGADPYNLTVDGDTFRSRQSQVGGRLIFQDKVGNKLPYKLMAEVSWKHEFANLDMPVNAAFKVGPDFNFVSFGAPRAANTVQVGGGGYLHLGKGVQIAGRIAYSYDSSQSGVAVLAGLQKSW
jgi:outer membrane autotransporter protein